MFKACVPLYCCTKLCVNLVLMIMVLLVFQCQRPQQLARTERMDPYLRKLCQTTHSCPDCLAMTRRCSNGEQHEFIARVPWPRWQRQSRQPRPRPLPLHLSGGCPCSSSCCITRDREPYLHPTLSAPEPTLFDTNLSHKSAPLKQCQFGTINSTIQKKSSISLLFE